MTHRIATANIAALANIDYLSDITQRALLDLADAREEIAALTADRDAAMVRAAKAEGEATDRPRLADAQGATIDALVRRAEQAEAAFTDLDRKYVALGANATAAKRDCDEARKRKAECIARAERAEAERDTARADLKAAEARVVGWIDEEKAQSTRADDLARSLSAAGDEITRLNRMLDDASAPRQMVADLRRDLEQRDIVVAAFAVVLREIARGTL